jgi:hypothetical protein
VSPEMPAGITLVTLEASWPLVHEWVVIAPGDPHARLRSSRMMWNAGRRKNARGTFAVSGPPRAIRLTPSSGHFTPPFSNQRRLSIATAGQPTGRTRQSRRRSGRASGRCVE